MELHVRKRLNSLVWFAVALLIVRVTISIVLRYSDYFPPNFYSEFLSGRKEFFHGAYAIAFYTHLLVSPLVLLVGLWLLSGTMRKRYPMLHRRLGRLNAMAIVFVVVPSSLWMSMYALTGVWAGSAFAITSCATLVCAVAGWRCAVARKFALHQVWMMRCYLLLCSAVVLRLLSGVATLIGVESLWSYPLFAWISSIVPIAVYESSRRWCSWAASQSLSRKPT